MCNAHNHPPGCSCGWGGVWYGNSWVDNRAWALNRGPKPRKTGSQHGTYSNLSTGHTNPNASCPVCGAPVYFYESPYGGRVYFDELGPPWPKHPCTSHDHIPRRSPTAESQGSVLWRYLGNVSIEKSVIGDVFTITGREAGKTLQFYFSADELVMAEIVRFRQREPGAFDISILDFDFTTAQWQTWSGIAQVKKTGIENTGKLVKEALAADQRPATKPQKVASSKIPKPSPRDDFCVCPVCNATLLRKNAQKHWHKCHSFIHITSNGVITGRLYNMASMPEF